MRSSKFFAESVCQLIPLSTYEITTFGSPFVYVFQARSRSIPHRLSVVQAAARLTPGIDATTPIESRETTSAAISLRGRMGRDHRAVPLGPLSGHTCSVPA